MHPMLECWCHYMLIFPIYTVLLFLIMRLRICISSLLMLRYHFIEWESSLEQFLMERIVHTPHLAIKVVALYILIKAFVTDKCWILYDHRTLSDNVRFLSLHGRITLRLNLDYWTLGLITNRLKSILQVVIQMDRWSFSWRFAFRLMFNYWLLLRNYDLITLN